MTEISEEMREYFRKIGAKGGKAKVPKGRYHKPKVTDDTKKAL